MLRPKLTRFSSLNPFSKAINQLNRAVSDQAGIRPGPGMGMMSGPSGRQIVLNSPILMYAKAVDAIPAAEGDGDDRKFGKGQVYPARISIDGDDLIIKASTENPITAYNMGLSEVAEGHWLILAKILNVWQVIWEECDSSS